VSLAHFVRGDFVTARDWAQRTVSTKSDWWLGHGLLAASRAHLEDAKGAREAGAELLRLFPKFSINSLPFPAVQDPRHAEVFRAGLRKAGVPDLSGEGVGNPARLEQMAEPRGGALAGSSSTIFATVAARRLSGYSPRARPSFSIAAPVTWKDVETGVRPDAFNISRLPSRPTRERG
jgi:hypothetical protein